MQFTGLYARKDGYVNYQKLGNPIYEDDIVEQSESYVKDGQLHTTKRIGVIKYVSAEFMIEYLAENLDEVEWDSIDGCGGVCVIGNIYENPELLEDK